MDGDDRNSKVPASVRPPPWARDSPSSSSTGSAPEPSLTDGAVPANGPPAASEPPSTVASSSSANEQPAVVSASTSTAESKTLPADHLSPAQMPRTANSTPPPRPSWQPPHSSWPPGPSNPRITLLSDLKRLSYVLSLLLGSSAIIGLFFSTFVLPLLHSTFSARGVLMDQQRPRWARLVQGLRALRGVGLLPPAKIKSSKKQAAGSGLEAAGSVGNAPAHEETEPSRAQLNREHLSGIEEIPSSASSGTSEKDKPRRQDRKAIDSRAHDDESAPTAEDDSDLNLDVPSPAHQHPLPVRNLTTLSTSLAALSSAISSTSTTRVSLLSTLESYTSHLHREVYLRSDHASAGGSSFSVGLGSLSQNLASAGAKVNGANGANGTSSGRTDWDDVRREVRAVKGLLLGRRNFVPVR